MSIRQFAALLLVLAAPACREKVPEAQFPKAHRPVSPIVGDQFSTEDARDRLGEAEEVMRLAEVRPGMWVADIGAGEGYYTVRLSPVVGPHGRVLAEDIVEGTYHRLAQRVQRGNLDNVAVKLGKPNDPMLPPRSFDRIFLVHMYHEVGSPYEFLWNLREGLKEGGQVIVVDADRPTNRHGTPPALLQCELGAVGLRLIKAHELAGGDSYFMAFGIAGPRPEPGQIQACKS